MAKGCKRNKKINISIKGGRKMKLKKILGLGMAMVLTLSMLAGCEAKEKAATTTGGEGTEVTEGTEATEVAEVTSETAGDGKLVVWTLADDLVRFGERYQEQTGVEMDVVVIAPDDYATKVQSALLGGEKEPDIIVGEPQMLEDFYDAGFFEDLDQAPYNAQDYDGQIVDYVWEVGKDKEGVQRAISFGITPAGMYYRTDIAEKIFGTSDPDEVSKLFADYKTVLESAQTAKDAGYRLFASDLELNYFSGDTAWVVDDTLNVDQARFDYLDLCVELYQKDLTAYAVPWATPWYQAMSGPVPILSAETQWGTDDMNVWDKESFEEATEGMQTTEVMAYGLPSWGVVIMRANVGDTSGLWKVAKGPSYGFGGGTYLGISTSSERKDTAWDFIKFVCLNEETADWWIEASEGDTVSLISALEKHKDDENPVYGGQKLYAFWAKEAEGIDYSKVTRYDTQIGDAWNEMTAAVKTGEKNKEEALAEFYDVVASTYPELTINR